MRWKVTHRNSAREVYAAMSRVLQSTPRPVGSRVILILLAAGHVLRAVLRTRGAQPSIPVLLIAAARDRVETGLDDAAGCEFVDDRIRLRE